MEHADDIDLVRRVLAKDRAAFDSFFESYFARLYRFAVARMSDESAVEDVVQETLIKALRNLGSYRGEARLFTWLCQICRHAISDWYARTGKRQEMMLSLDDDPAIAAILETLESADPAPAESELELLGLKQIIQLTLDYLPDRYGRVLEWKYLEGLSVEEIAARLKVSQPAAQSLLARARTAFRNGFNELKQELGTAAG